MITQFFLPNRDKVFLEDIAARKHRGVLLGGSEVQQNNSEIGIITVQEFQKPLFAISYRIFELFSKIKLSIHEAQVLDLKHYSMERYIFPITITKLS